jgi:hypothetical protein
MAITVAAIVGSAAPRRGAQVGELLASIRPASPHAGDAATKDHEPGRKHPPRAEPISRRTDGQDQRGVFCLPAFRMTAGLPGGAELGAVVAVPS